jgi:hypothetical protein
VTTAPADLAVEAALALVVEDRRHGVKPLDHQPADGALLAEPDRRADDQDLGRRDLAPERGPGVLRPAVLVMSGWTP